MINIITNADQIKNDDWKELTHLSSTATWFQTPEAYHFFNSLPTIFTPFIFAVTNNNTLKGICVGYITSEHNPIKQLLTRRAIIIGGPMLANDITTEELSSLLKSIKNTLKHKAIYIETRNFNDFSKHKDTFIRNGFNYIPHLNFHIDTTSEETFMNNLGKSRKRDIKTSLRDGATIITEPSFEQITEYYKILKHLYKTKVKTPLFPIEFFEQLYNSGIAHFLLISLNDKIIGGTMCVGLPNTALYEWFACGEDGLYKNIYPSTLATFAGIQFAAINNYPKFDMMGAGKPNEGYGVRDFKAKFGGKLVEHGRFLNIINPLLYWVGSIGVKLIKRFH